MAKASRYYAYVDTTTAESCCSDGHATAADALQHAADRRKEKTNAGMVDGSANQGR